MKVSDLRYLLLCCRLCTVVFAFPLFLSFKWKHI